jgi:hypothetical protein
MPIVTTLGYVGARKGGVIPIQKSAWWQSKWSIVPLLALIIQVGYFSMALHRVAMCTYRACHTTPGTYFTCA